MKIQMLVTMITSRGTYYKGQVADVQPELAKQWISKGRALSLEPAKVAKTEVKPPQGNKRRRPKRK
ncbi:MAG: hypothetical protein PHQ43_13985 [Dehalococcoidales bacterium]|nr:hypothetical protein [Dehalococcoidales bacterium]